MHKLENVTLIPVSSEYAEPFTTLLNRVVWRDKWEIERYNEVEKKLKEVKYHDYKKPLLLIRRNSDEQFLGYVSVRLGEFGSLPSFQAFADPTIELDETSWLETLEYTLRFLFEKSNQFCISTYSIVGYDPLLPLYKRIGFTSIGIEPKSRFVQGKSEDMDVLEYIYDNPFPLTRVDVNELTGAGGTPPDWRLCDR